LITTAFSIWKILQETFTKSLGRRKLELKNKINNALFNPEDHINIFVTTLENDLIELEKIDHNINNINFKEI